MKFNLIQVGSGITGERIQQRACQTGHEDILFGMIGYLHSFGAVPSSGQEIILFFIFFCL